MKKSLIRVVIAAGFGIAAVPSFAYESPADDPYWKYTTPRVASSSVAVPAISSSAMVMDCAAASTSPYHLADDHNP